MVSSLLLLLGLASLHAARYWGHFQLPSLFAEEGIVFLAEYLKGSPSLLNAGYFNLFAGSLIPLLSKISIRNLPLLSSAMAVIFSTVSVAYLLLPHWEKMLPWRFRAFIVLFFLGFSPFHEGIAILLYSFWWFAIGTVLLLLEQLYLPEVFRKHLWLKLSYIVVGSLSGPAVLMTAAPLLGAFFLVRWKREGFIAVSKRAISLWPTLFCLFVTGLIQTSLFKRYGEVEPASAAEYWLQFPKATLFQLNMRVFGPSLFSLEGARWLNHSDLRASLSLLLLLVVCAQFFLQKRTKSERTELCWILLFAGIGSTWILYLGRPFMFESFRSKPYHLQLEGMRYSFVPGFLFFCALVSAFSNLRSLRLQQIYGGLLIPLIVVSGILNFKSTEPVFDVRWHETARQIEEFRKGERDTISGEIIPKGYGFQVKRPTRS